MRVSLIRLFSRLPVAGRLVWVAIALATLITGCSLPQVSVEERMFLNLSLDFLGAYELPKQTIEGVPLGGLSGITYDRERDRFYAISDDRSDKGPARFYTLKLMIEEAAVASPASDSASTGTPPGSTPPGSTPPDSMPLGSTPNAIAISRVEIEKTTVLLAEDGGPYLEGTIDAEGIALTPRQTVFISSEGVADDEILPFISEFDLATGKWLSSLPISERYVPRIVDGQPQGVQNNLGFEGLTLGGSGAAGGYREPFRIFVGVESALVQDLNPATPSQAVPIRLLHYLVGEGLPLLLSEHLYFPSPAAQGTGYSGLTEILTLDQGGHFLSLERSFNPLTGFSIRLFQLAMGGATDISGVLSLKGDLSAIQPVRKNLLLDLNELGIRLDNLEGMTLGPRLPDGSQSLVLVSDDNFNAGQVTQFLLFRLRLG